LAVDSGHHRAGLLTLPTWAGHPRRSSACHHRNLIFPENIGAPATRALIAAGYTELATLEEAQAVIRGNS